MKKLTSILLITIAFQSLAALWTVNMNPKAGAQFLNVQSAVDSASAGDTIYVHGNNSEYASFTITKQLVVIGEGYSAQGIFLPATKITSIVFDSSGVGETLDGSVLIGLRFSNLGNKYYSEGQVSNDLYGTVANNVIVERCYMTGYSNGSGINGYRPKILGDNWIVRNCRITTLEVNDYNNLLISNCYFDASSSNHRVLWNSNQSTVSLKNCVFLNTYSTSDSDPFFNCSGMTIQNSIFSAAYTGLGISQSQFQNCLFSNEGSLDSATVAGTTNIVENCMFDEDPTDFFANAATYEINESHPAKTGATDGNELGVFGGGFPMADLRGTPNLPLIYGFEIENVVVEPQGTLKVKVKVKSQN